MPPKGKIGITIDLKVWKQLSFLKIELVKRSFSDVIESLIEGRKKNGK